MEPNGLDATMVDLFLTKKDKFGKEHSRPLIYEIPKYKAVDLVMALTDIFKGIAYDPGEFQMFVKPSNNAVMAMADNEIVEE